MVNICLEFCFLLGQYDVGGGGGGSNVNHAVVQGVKADSRVVGSHKDFQQEYFTNPGLVGFKLLRPDGLWVPSGRHYLQSSIACLVLEYV